MHEVDEKDMDFPSEVFGAMWKTIFKLVVASKQLMIT